MNRAKFEDYEEFVEKFKVKKTTDECWTPPEIYDVVRDWACAEYGIDAAKIVRPFYPGGDYERFDYSGGKVVLDNPPFSILSRILSFYLDRGIPFFLFAPGLTAFSSQKTVGRACRVLVDCGVVYANGAAVQTAFVTSYDAGCALRTAPELSRRLRDKVAELSRRGKKKMRSYDFPPHLLRAAGVKRLASLGVDFRVPAEECVFVSRLDAMPNGGGGIRRRAAGLGPRRGGIRGGDARGGDARGAREKLRGRDSAGAERAGTRDRRFARAREKLTRAFACVPAAPRA